jgi:hypothetical protein
MVAVKIGYDGFADSVRMIPEWDRPTPNLGSVVAKVPSVDRGRRAAGFATRAYEREVAFYRDLASTLGVYRPICYLASYEPVNQAYIVLMEDLSPAEAGDPVAGCPPEDAAAVMPELAGLHAPRWGDSSLLGVRCLDRPDPETVRGMAQLVPLLWPDFVDRYQDRVLPVALELGEQLMGSLEGYLLDRPGPWTVLHGDFRLDNLLFGGPRVAVLDWETVKIGPGLSDVAHFIGSALSVEDRREHEAHLVRAYRSSLTAADVPISWEDCWAEYRRYSFDGFLMAVSAAVLPTAGGATTAPGGVGHADVIVSMVNRHAQQAVDLGAVELLTGRR